MKHEEQVRVLKGLMDRLDAGTNVDVGYQLKNPTSSYTDKGIAAREWEHFFQKHPQLLGLSADLPEPGSFFTNNDLGKPILCTRDMEGTFRAFLNVCRHRGAVVETEARGRKKLFSCPFHAWSYSSNGDLVAVPKEDHFGSVDRTCNSLVALPAVEKYGMLWVSPQQGETFDVDDLLGKELAEELASWDFGSCTRHSATTYPHACNWKLANDTYGETYHFSALHKDTLFPSFYGNVQMYDTYKRNHRMALCMRNIDTMRSEPTEKWHVLRGTVPVYFLFPNIQLVLTRGGPVLVRIYPDGDNPDMSRSELTSYYFPEAFSRSLVTEADDLEVSDMAGQMEGFAAVIQAEDYVIAASSHAGARSGALDHLIFGRNEPALHHYHSTFRRELNLPALEKV